MIDPCIQMHDFYAMANVRLIDFLVRQQHPTKIVYDKPQEILFLVIGPYN